MPGSGSTFPGEPEDTSSRLAVELKASNGFDYRTSIAQVEQGIAAIEAGLRMLSGPISG
jgi:hypothetical protein